MDRAKNLRNLAIVLLIAAAVFAIPGGGRAAKTFEAALFVVFGVAIGYLGLRMYREYRINLYGLGDRFRALLYGAIAVAGFAVLAQKRMWQTSLGELVWFVLVGLVVYAVLAVIRHARSY
ncbi:MAG: hypothetical protein E6F96_05140 [Actinobacteria bacterium]|nr:MAG: hypothetical protein E6F96_05140 [Actinomycetota bacterium]